MTAPLHKAGSGYAVAFAPKSTLVPQPAYSGQGQLQGLIAQVQANLETSINTWQGLLSVRSFEKCLLDLQGLHLSRLLQTVQVLPVAFIDECLPFTEARSGSWPEYLTM